MRRTFLPEKLAAGCGPGNDSPETRVERPLVRPIVVATVTVLPIPDISDDPQGPALPERE